MPTSPKTFRNLMLTALTVCASLFFSDPAKAVTTTVFATPPPPLLGSGTIGFAYAGDKFVGTGYFSSLLYSTDLTGGNIQPFAPGLVLETGNGEHFISSSIGKGGFPNRDLYVASGAGIVHVTHDGSSNNPFITNLNGIVRGILFDSVGTFGNDMIVTTSSGTIYRVKSNGSSSILASVGEDTEGLDIAPIGTPGGLSGKLVVASEGSGSIRAIDTNGVVTPVTNVAGAEELTFVPLNLGASGNPVEGFYGANYTPNIIKIDAPQFNGMQGDIVVTGEFSHLINRIHFDGVNFVTTVIGQFPNQPEDGIFVTADIIGPTPGVPEPCTLALMGVGAAAAAFARRRAKSVA